MICLGMQNNWCQLIINNIDLNIKNVLSERHILSNLQCISIRLRSVVLYALSSPLSVFWTKIWESLESAPKSRMALRILLFYCIWLGLYGTCWNGQPRFNRRESGYQNVSSNLKEKPNASCRKTGHTRPCSVLHGKRSQTLTSNCDEFDCPNCLT